MGYCALNDKERRLLYDLLGLKRDTIKNCLYHPNQKKKKKKLYGCRKKNNLE
jgi:hypothetical protein